MPNIKENTISLFLLSISDKIKQNPVVSGAGGARFTKLSTSLSTVDTANAFEILRRESELFSFNPMPNGEIAHELFSDKEEGETRSDDYVVHHDIVFKQGDKYYKFNIEKQNLNNTSALSQRDIEKPITGFYIQSIQIKNAPKDTFTTRANYTITIKILFNFFDDLLKDVVPVYPVNADLENPDSLQAALFEKPIIHLLYKNYIQNNSNLIANMQDTKGIYLVQRLQFNSSTKHFKKTKEFLGDNQLGKTYHLMSKKHEFNICKSNEAASTPFDNELTIEYVASEVEGIPEQGEKIAEFDRVNLFNLLNDSSLSNSLTTTSTSRVITPDVVLERSSNDNIISQLSYYQRQLELYKSYQDFISSQLNCKKLYDELKSKNDTRANAVQAYSTINEEQLKQNFEFNKKQIEIIVFEMKRALMLQILLKCKIFELKNVQFSLLNTFEQNFDFSEYASSLGWGRGIGLVAQIGIAGGITYATGGTAGAVIGVGASSLLPEVAAFISEVVKEPLVSSDLDLQNIRNNVNTNSIIQITTSGSQQQKIQQIFPNLQTRSSAAGSLGGAGAVNTSTLAASGFFAPGRDVIGKEKEIASEIQTSLGIVAPEASQQSDVGGETSIRFIRFQDIIDIYQGLNPQVKIMSGGKMIVAKFNNANPEFLYLNNADVVISLEAFTSFLYKNIILKDRKLFYDSEEFLRDAFQALIGKDLLAANDSVSDEIKKLAPTNLRFNTSINVDTGALGAAISPGDFEILNDSSFINLKKQIFLTRNICSKNFTTGANLVKLLFLGSEQSIMYYDFYQEYGKWAAINLAPADEKSYSSRNFQRFINEKFLFSCVPIRNSSIAETILKAKNVTFSRIDNKNLETGVNISDETRRLPYQIKTKLQPYLTFFMGSSNYMFVAPPDTGDGSNNLFGFGGLYIIKQTNFEWNFTSANSANPIFVSSYDIDGYHVSYGDGVKLTPSPSAIPPTGANCNGIPLTASRVT